MCIHNVRCNDVCGRGAERMRGIAKRTRVMVAAFVDRERREEKNPSNKSVRQPRGGNATPPTQPRVGGCGQRKGCETPSAFNPEWGAGISSLAVPHLFHRQHPIQLHRSRSSLHTFRPITVHTVTRTPTFIGPFARKSKWLRWRL